MAKVYSHSDTNTKEAKQLLWSAIAIVSVYKYYMCVCLRESV